MGEPLNSLCMNRCCSANPGLPERTAGSIHFASIGCRLNAEEGQEDSSVSVQSMRGGIVRSMRNNTHYLGYLAHFLAE